MGAISSGCTCWKGMTRVVGNMDVPTGATASETSALPIVQTVNEEAAESVPPIYRSKGIIYEKSKYFPYRRYGIL